MTLRAANLLKTNFPRNLKLERDYASLEEALRLFEQNRPVAELRQTERVWRDNLYASGC